MPKYLDSTGLGYFWGKIKNYIKWRNVRPEQSKTFTGVIATANTDPAGWLYFGWVKPDDYYIPYKIRYRIVSEMPGLSAVTGFKTSYFDVEVRGVADTYYSYSVENVQNTSYRSLFGHLFYSCTKTGIDAGYGPLLGFRLQGAYGPTTAAYARTIKIDIIETENCDFAFYDVPLVYASVPGTGSTNYKTRTTFDGTTNGHTQAGDRNDGNYYNRIYYSCRTTYTALYRYQICLSRSDRTLLPVNTSNNVIAKTKTMTTESFDPFGEILYWASTTTYAAGANVGDGSLYNQNLADIRYAFNCGGNDVDSTLVARKPLYLVAVPNADGTAHLYSEPLAQELPDSEDGLLYIYLGQVYPDAKPYRLYMSIRHPVYAYKNGSVRVYTQYADYAHNSDLVNGHTVESDVPANAVFTDTTYSSMTQAQATAGTSTDGMLISPKVLVDTIGSNVTVVVEDNKIKLISR